MCQSVPPPGLQGDTCQDHHQDTASPEHQNIRDNTSRTPPKHGMPPPQHHHRDTTFGKPLRVSPPPGHHHHRGQHRNMEHHRRNRTQPAAQHHADTTAPPPGYHQDNQNTTGAPAPRYHGDTTSAPTRQHQVTTGKALGQHRRIATGHRQNTTGTLVAATQPGHHQNTAATPHATTLQRTPAEQHWDTINAPTLPNTIIHGRDASRTLRGHRLNTSGTTLGTKDQDTAGTLPGHQHNTTKTPPTPRHHRTPRG